MYHVLLNANIVRSRLELLTSVEFGIGTIIYLHDHLDVMIWVFVVTLPSYELTLSSHCTLSQNWIESVSLTRWANNSEESVNDSPIKVQVDLISIRTSHFWIY